MAERGIFPSPPLDSPANTDLQRPPSGAMHFVSSSDLHAGYFYTMGDCHVA
jgi:hypothetical protein